MVFMFIGGLFNVFGYGLVVFGLVFGVVWIFVVVINGIVC